MRSCTDVFCIAVFAIIFLLTFGGGGYFIYQGKDKIAEMALQTGTALTTNPTLPYIMATTVGPIVGMLVLAGGLSILLVVCTKNFPKATMFFLIGFTFAVYIGFIIVGFVMNSLGLAIAFIVVLAVNALVLYCMREYIAVGLKLVECAARFIT